MYYTRICRRRPFRESDSRGCMLGIRQRERENSNIVPAVAAGVSNLIDKQCPRSSQFECVW